MRRLSVILNSARADVDTVAGQVRAAGASRTAEVHVKVEIVPGADLGDAARRALAAGSCTVAAGGGDGTISAVAAAIAGTRATLGVLPLGTLNHFARDIRIPRDMEKAIAVLFDGDVKEVDVGEVNGRAFINNCSVGLYPRLVWEREQRQRQGHRKGTAAVAAAWTVWRRYRRVTVDIERESGDATHVHTPFVFVGNNPYQLTGLDFG